MAAALEAASRARSRRSARRVSASRRSPAARARSRRCARRAARAASTSCTSAARTPGKRFAVYSRRGRCRRSRCRARAPPRNRARGGRREVRIVDRGRRPAGRSRRPRSPAPRAARAARPSARSRGGRSPGRWHRPLALLAQSSRPSHHRPLTGRRRRSALGSRARALRWCRRSRTSSRARRARRTARALPATWSSAHSGSGSSRLIVGGSTPVSSARTQSSASTAPAAPSRWPVIDLVAETGSEPACAAEHRADRARLGRVAGRRARRVRVQVVDVARRRARRPRARAACSAARPPRPRSGCAMCARVGGGAVAEQAARGSARRARARAPRPRARARPRPRPSRSRRGRGRTGGSRAAGSSLRVESARIVAKPATTTARDRRLGAAGQHRVRVAALDRARRLADRVRAGSAGADVAEVRARAGRAGSRRKPPGMLRSPSGSRTARRGAARSSSVCDAVARACSRPPIPEPTATPTRSRLARRPASFAAASASRAAASASTIDAVEPARLLGRHVAEVELARHLAGDARPGSSQLSKRVSAAMPLVPATAAPPGLVGVVPSGVTQPSPVTTTRACAAGGFTRLELLACR